MRSRVIVALTLLAALAAAPFPALADGPFQGENLISPLNEYDTHLMDLDGNIAKTWHGAHRPASIAYLRDDGAIVRPCKLLDSYFGGGGSGGRIQIIDADDIVVWDYEFSTADHKQHHDIEPLPNGNVLLIAWEAKTGAEASDAGRQDVGDVMWPTLIVEVEPVGGTGGSIVWEWHLWDHLVQDVDVRLDNYGVIADHPELMDVNYGTIGGSASPGDWIHANAIDYNEELDQIVFCSRTLSELYVIDHSTTTAEAAGHTGGNSGMGGDILYRWGNPQVYGRGDADDEKLFVAHGVNWIPAGMPGEGNILIFNNGDRAGGLSDYSTVEEVTPPVDPSGNYSITPGEAFGPSASTWTYGESGDFYAGASQCGAYRLPNGNTQICASEASYLFEVTASGETVWDYDHPVGAIARAERYWTHNTDVPSDEDDTMAGTLHVFGGSPNPFGPSTSLAFTVPVSGHVRLEIVSSAGRRVAVLADGHRSAGEHVVGWNGTDDSGRSVSAGVYLARLRSGAREAVSKITLVR